MPKRALANHRPWLLASIIAAVAYYFLRDSHLGGLWLMLVKGAAVACLAAYALHRGVGRSALILAIAMALSALGDMGMELSMEAGGTLFFLSHLAAITLYLKNLRKHPTFSQKALAVTLLLGTPYLCWQLSHDGPVALYGLALGGMAAAAWMSRFTRYRVGIGAVLFVLSDLLIFSRMGPFDLGVLPDLLIWPVYYSAQFLIATGVVQTLRRDHKA